MDFKTASLGELLTYWERQRRIADEKLRHLHALLGDDAEPASETTTQAAKELAPLSKPVASPTPPVPAQPAVDPTSNTMGQMHVLLPAFINAQSGTFTRRQMMDYLEAHGLQVSRQNMHHAVSTLRKKGVIVEQAADPGAATKYVYAKGPNA